MVRSDSTASTRTFITPPPEPPKPPKPPKVKRQLQLPKFRRPSTVSLSGVIIGVLVLLVIFLFVQYRDARHKLDSAATNKQQISSLTAKIRKLVVVPADQTPTVATVVHANTLHSQAFFANAQDGDKVIVYSAEKEAILYRPSTNQIVNIAPVSPTGAQTGQ